MWGAIIAAVAGIVSMIISSEAQKSTNRETAQFQALQNEKYLAQQQEYNSPKAQMARFQAAGLNPHLIYGQGSPGQQTAPLSYPDIKTPDLMSLGRGISSTVTETLPLINQSKLVESQVQAQNASTLQKHAQVELTKLQQKVLERNPALDDDTYKSMLDSLKMSAALKAGEIKGQNIKNFVSEASSGHQVSKVFHEVNLLEQRFKLGQLDSKLKAEVLKSKEFQNAILEVQKKFMTDGDITPQHILQFIQMLLMKSM